MTRPIFLRRHAVGRLKPSAKMSRALEARHGSDLMNGVTLERARYQPLARLGQTLAPEELGERSNVVLQHIAKITWRNAAIRCNPVTCEIRGRQILLYARLNVSKPFINQAAGRGAARDVIANAVRDRLQESLGQRLGRAAAHMVAFEAQQIEKAGDNLAVPGSDFERRIEHFGPGHVRQHQMLRHNGESTLKATAVTHGCSRIERLVGIDESASAGVDRGRGPPIHYLQLALIDEIEQTDGSFSGVDVVPATPE